MRKFEHLEVSPTMGKGIFGGIMNDSKFLSEKGAEGWELVNVVYPLPKGIVKYYFKREIQ
jgi:hypothetical protein